jgi:hypothetical protein
MRIRIFRIFGIFRIRLFVGCGDSWDLEDLDNWMDANIFAISATHQYPNPENPENPLNPDSHDG